MGVANSPRSIIQYYSIEQYIRRVLLIPAYAATCSIRSISERVFESLINFGDILQGRLFLDEYEKITKKHRLDYLFAFVFHNDSLKLLDFSVSSVTPILAFNCCLPPAVRFKFGAMICLSIFPRKAKNIEMLSVPIIAELKQLAAVPFTANVAQHDGKRTQATIGVINFVLLMTSKRLRL